MVTHTLPQKAYSVAKIESPEVMDENGKQKVGGLMDPKMGSKWKPRLHRRRLTYL
jgi:DNA-directed RNA polymerase beta' subunit